MNQMTGYNVIFVFKQKTAYEMRISDWSSDVCSSDLRTTIKQAFDSSSGEPMTNTQFSTKDRILGAAEELFAQHGFSGPSLRQVTSRAAVNIAAVNYHFGSKENLVTAVIPRRMVAMSAPRLGHLRQAPRQDPAPT